MNTHLMLVSGQATPNLTPALDPAVKPERIIQLVTSDMQQRAQWLADIYRPRGIQSEPWPIDNAWDIEHIQSRVLDLLVREAQAVSAKSLVLNATGGTKPMSIAAYEVFRAEGLPIYYVHPKDDRLIWLHPSDRPSHQLADRIGLRDFIRAHGGEVESLGRRSVPGEYRELAQQLVQHVDQYGNALGVLNYYANDAEGNLRSKRLDDKHLEFDRLQDLVERFHRIGILNLRNQRLEFASEEARFFANGGWLEQYVFATVNRLKRHVPTIQDTAQGVEIVRGTANTKNELDVAVLANNRLYLIECKVKNFKRGASGSGTETLYKLDSIADTVGGLQARAMLVSYKPLPKYDAQRAQDLRIEVLQGRDLQQLRMRLKAWLS